MLRIEPFKPEHIVQIAGRNDVEGKWANCEASSMAKQHWLTESHPAYTVFDNDKVLGCAGILIIWRNILSQQSFGEAWVWVNEELTKKHRFWFHRNVKAILGKVIKEYKLIRIQCEVDINYKTGQKWAKALGFKEESIMPSYGPTGETYIKFVILNNFQEVN